MDTTLYCKKCNQTGISEDDVNSQGLHHIKMDDDEFAPVCEGEVEEVCAYCLGEGMVAVDAPVYPNEPHYAPIGERVCICKLQAQQAQDADDAWKERE